MIAHDVVVTRVATVMAALLLAACCGTQKPKQQPPLDDQKVMAPPKEEPVVLEPPPPVVGLSVADLSSGEIRSLSMTLSGFTMRAGAQEGEAEQILEALKSGLRLFDETDRPVPGDVRFGHYDLDGKPVQNASGDALSFVPASPLRDGWYTLRARVDVLAKHSKYGLLLGGHAKEMELVARFFRGQKLFARGLQVHCAQVRRSPPVRGAEGKRFCYLSIDLSAPALQALGSSVVSSVQVRYAGQIQSCTLVDRSYRRAVDGLVFACPEPSPRTRIEVSSGSLASAGSSGPANWALDFPDQLRNVGTRSVPVWIAALPAR